MKLKSLQKCLLIVFTILTASTAQAQMSLLKTLKSTPAKEVADKKTDIMKEVLDLNSEQLESVASMNLDFAERRKKIIEDTSMFKLRGALKPLNEEEDQKLIALLTDSQKTLYEDSGKEEIRKQMRAWLDAKDN